LAAALGIKAGAAKNGDWWEIDLIIALLFGAFVAGGFAWTSL
jgi:hypothetical protein